MADLLKKDVRYLSRDFNSIKANLIDFTKTYSNLDILYPNFLPTSEVRVELWKQWEKLKDKHD